MNGGRVGVIDRTYVTPATVQVFLQKGDVPQLLVESLGRIDYGPPLLDQRKGIVGSVTVGGSVLANWAMYSLQLDELPISVLSPTSAPAPTGTNTPPLFYRGSFQLDNAEGKPALNLDTFLSLPDGVKGVVWVNGHKRARYWRVGPQQSLYGPGCILRTGRNEVVVLELEPGNNIGDFTAYGSAVREWFNNPDPDAPVFA